MSITYTNASFDSNDPNKARHELRSMDSNLQSRAAYEAIRIARLEDYMNNLRKDHPGWLSRLGLSKQDKAILQAYGEKELEAATILLSHQNQILTAISRAQLSFVTEVVNTLLKTGRAGLKSAAASIYSEALLNLQGRIKDTSTRLYDMIEEEYFEAEKRLPPIRTVIYERIDTMLRNWAKASLLLQEEFITILEKNL